MAHSLLLSELEVSPGQRRLASASDQEGRLSDEPSRLEALGCILVQPLDLSPTKVAESLRLRGIIEPQGEKTAQRKLCCLESWEGSVSRLHTG